MDAVILLDGVVFVIEYKVGTNQYHKHAIDQVLDYALDLKNFHEGSHSRTIVPVLVATAAPTVPLEVGVWSDDLVQPIMANRSTLLSSIKLLSTKFAANPLDAQAWSASPYKPTPTIVEAAQALYQGHDVHIDRPEY